MEKNNFKYILRREKEMRGTDGEKDRREKMQRKYINKRWRRGGKDEKKENKKREENKEKGRRDKWDYINNRKKSDKKKREKEESGGKKIKNNGYGNDGRK